MRLVVYAETAALGGAEIVTGHLVEALRPDIEVIAMGPHPSVIEYLAGRRPGTEAIIVPPVRSAREIRSLPAHRRILRSLSPAIFQAVLTFQTACQWPLVAAKSVHGVIPIAVEHLDPSPDTRRGRAARRRLRRTLAAHIAVSRDLARSVESADHLPAGSLVTISNGVPDLPFRPTAVALPPPVIGTVGRFDVNKGLDVLVQAAALLPEATVALVGAGADEMKLRALVTELELVQRVHFIDWTDDARDWLAAFDVVVVPSRAETFGLVALEAMLAERPVVASAVGGLPEVVEDGLTGILVPPDDPDALAAALTIVLADPDLRTRMGARGRRRALDCFSVEAMARSYEALYDRLVASDAA